MKRAILRTGSFYSTAQMRRWALASFTDRQASEAVIRLVIRFCHPNVKNRITEVDKPRVLATKASLTSRRSLVQVQYRPLKRTAEIHYSLQCVFLLGLNSVTLAVSASDLRTRSKTGFDLKLKANWQIVSATKAWGAGWHPNARSLPPLLDRQQRYL